MKSRYLRPAVSMPRIYLYRDPVDFPKSYRGLAAIVDQEGRVHVGCNVENASYGLSVCAERHAIAAAVSAGAQQIEAIAVVTETDPPSAPCGACRQVLVEFGDFPVVLANTAGERVLTTVNDLLPDAFTSGSLLER